jgi:CHAT domain-containing protein
MPSAGIRAPLLIAMLLMGCSPLRQPSPSDTAGPSVAAADGSLPESSSGAQPSQWARQAADALAARQYEQAQRTLRLSIGSARQLHNQSELAASLNNLANLEAERGDDDAALAAYRECAEVAGSAGNPMIKAKALSNAAKILLRNKRFGDAEASLLAAQESVRPLPETLDKADLLIGIGRALHQLQGFVGHPTKSSEAAYQALANGLTIAERLDSGELSSYGYGYVGDWYFGAKRYREALEYAAKALFSAQSLLRPDLLVRWQWLEARILRAAGEKDQALAAYRRTIGTLQPIRHHWLKLPKEAADESHHLYLEYVELLLQRDSVSQADLHAIRAQIEEAKTLELENYFRDDCVVAWQEKAAGIDRLASRTAALYPIALSERTELLVSLPGSMERYTIPVGREQLSREAHELRARLEKRTTREYLPRAQRLYDLLIKPVEAELQKNGIDTLVFVPDAALRTIPLAALHDGRDFLVKRYAIATSPGLTLTDPHAIDREAPATLLIGLSEGTGGFSGLPNVEEELAQVSQQFPGEMMVNQAFQRGELQQRLADKLYRIVHIASHGRFSGNADDNFVLAYDGKIDMNQLGTLMSYNRFRQEPVELLTLSACQTAAGDDQAALGLAGIAVKAGARSALASLWFINDPASSSLVSGFYRALKQPGTSKAMALRHAQTELLSDPRYRHPGYWAPFLLIGNWL